MSPIERRLLEYLSNLLTPHRRQRFTEVLAERTRWLTVVLEDPHHAHNLSAVLRSCDAFGVQDVHLIQVRSQIEIESKVSMAAERWLTIEIAGSGPPDPKRPQIPPDPATTVEATRHCLERLKTNGYKLVATTPHARSRPIEELDLSQPIALIFGNERQGLSPLVLAEADELTYLPMHGFSESFNLSVAAAISLYSLSTRLRSSQVAWQLPTSEREQILLNWTRNSIPNVELIEKRYRQELK